MIDWQRLVVRGSRRAAIFDERFPARLDDAMKMVVEAGGEDLTSAFTEGLALDLLRTVADAWSSLGEDDGGRYIYSAIPPDPTMGAVLWFKAEEPIPGQVVVVDVGVSYVRRRPSGATVADA